MSKLKKGDKVIVIAGKYKGTVSDIENILGDEVIVRNVNKVKKAVKGQGFVEKHLPIHVSNVQYYSEKLKKGEKIGISVSKTGKKTRKGKKSGEELK